MTQTTKVTSRASTTVRTAPPISYLVGGSRIRGSQKALGASIDEALKHLEGTDVEEFDDSRFNDIQEAELLIDQVIEGAITVARLTSTQRQKISYYLSVFNPLISRIISLHTKLPLSTLRIQKPPHEIDIVQDYVYSFFNKIVNSSKFKEALEDIIRNYWTLGRGIGRLEDDYSFLKDTLLDPEVEKINLMEISEENMKKAFTINKNYNSDPTSVNWASKKEVLDLFLMPINPNYKGIHSYKSIHPLDLIGCSINTDIDYYVYEVAVPDGIKKWLNSGTTTKENETGVKHPLVKLGYSQGLVGLVKASNGANTIEIDTDPFGTDGVYMTQLQTSHPLINACLESAIYNMAAIKHNNALVGLSSKIDRLISAKGASAEQLAVLNESLAEMAESPEGSAIAVNFEVSVEELSLDVKNLVDLDATIERTNKEIMSATGMPEELVTEGGSYGSGFLKVELLSHEYVEFRNRLKSFIENQIFTPISIKKGFITSDEWGNTVPLIPPVRFDKLSLARSSEDFSQMVDLVLSNKLPSEMLYDAMGLEIEDIKQKLTREKGTILDQAVQDAVASAISNLDSILVESPELKQRLLDALNITLTKDLSLVDPEIHDEDRAPK
jgi:hypothetical protein